ncbi:MAG: hypothetical protein K2K90_13235 [Lachnospiraceae bacterium]|nr:hypothetical protein [Lachnospiraceae bacterium]
MKKYVLFGTICAGLCFGSIRFFRTKRPDRYFQWYKTLYQWVLIRQEQIQIADYFRGKGYKRVAVYGMGELGRLFLRELRDKDIEIPYVIDQNARSISVPGIKTIELKDVKQDVDVIVVSVVDKFETIKADIERNVDVPVISLDDVLFSL